MNKSVAARSLAMSLLEFAPRMDAAEVAIDPTVTMNRIDERIYGFLLEHIYRSCSAGIWGEEVVNRSFEQRANLTGRYVVGHRQSGSFEVRVTGDDSVIGVRDGARERMRTNYVDWHVGEGFVESPPAGVGIRRRRTWRVSLRPCATAWRT